MKTRLGHAVLWIAIAAALGLVFAAYLRPDVVVDLANQIWSCF